MSEQRSRSASTPQRIIQAALETLREEGFAGATARSIAKRGDFNQALIFYHFGSVANLLLQAFLVQSDEQVAKYREAAATVSSLSDLVAIAQRLHEEDMRSGAITAVTQLMAAASSPAEGKAILDRFENWIAIVQNALGRAMGAPLSSVVPTREAAYAIAGMFLGIELISRLDPERSEADSVFAMMANLAQLIEQLGPLLMPRP
jgi:AcrR family transcriptional regulator